MAFLGWFFNFNISEKLKESSGSEGENEYNNKNEIKSFVLKGDRIIGVNGWGNVSSSNYNYPVRGASRSSEVTQIGPCTFKIVEPSTKFTQLLTIDPDTYQTTLRTI